VARQHQTGLQAAAMVPGGGGSWLQGLLELAAAAVFINGHESVQHECW
jgi:hypothetical protein